MIDLTRWPSDNDAEIEWKLCVICQRTSDESLITPTEKGYTSLAENLVAFNEKALLPTHLRLFLSNGSSTAVQALLHAQAKYHKSCRNRYDTQKLERMCKSQANEHVEANLPSTSSPRKTRSSSETLNIKEMCIFCNASQKAQEQLVN